MIFFFPQLENEEMEKSKPQTNTALTSEMLKCTSTLWVDHARRWKGRERRQTVQHSLVCLRAIMGRRFLFAINWGPPPPHETRLRQLLHTGPPPPPAYITHFTRSLCDHSSLLFSPPLIKGSFLFFLGSKTDKRF